MFWRNDAPNIFDALGHLPFLPPLPLCAALSIVTFCGVYSWRIIARVWINTALTLLAMTFWVSGMSNILHGIALIYWVVSIGPWRFITSDDYSVWKVGTAVCKLQTHPAGLSDGIVFVPSLATLVRTSSTPSAALSNYQLKYTVPDPYLRLLLVQFHGYLSDGPAWPKSVHLVDEFVLPAWPIGIFKSAISILKSFLVFTGLLSCFWYNIVAPALSPIRQILISDEF